MPHHLISGEHEWIKGGPFPSKLSVNISWRLMAFYVGPFDFPAMKFLSPIFRGWVGVSLAVGGCHKNFSEAN